MIAILAILALPQAVALAAPGDLDDSFGADGVSRISGSDSSFLAASLQADGKLVAAGRLGSRLLVARFERDGELDPTFAEDGIFTTSAASQGSGLAIQADGRIVVAATTFGRMAALRLGADGTLDGSFSGDGVATAPGDGSRGLDVALQGSRVVVSGSRPSPRDGYDRTALARFHADGSVDQSFGEGGARLYDFGRITVANAVTIDAAERILIAGSQRHNLQSTNVLVARLGPNGDPDPSFGGNVGIPGLFVKDMARSAAYAAAFDVVMDPAGRVLIAGAATNGRPVATDPQGADGLAVRLTAEGTLDPSFGGGGVVYLPAATHKDQYNKRAPLPGAYGLVLGGGDIILAGYHDDLTRKRLALWALRYDGTPDPAFGSGGSRITAIGDGSAQLRTLAIAADGSLLATGDSTAQLGSPRGLAARYHGVGPPPGEVDAGPGPAPEPGPAPPRCFGKPATIVGTPGSDLLRGTGKRDVIFARSGVDRIIASGGGDLVCGGAGNDRVYLQSGDDKASGGAGADLLAGSFGADVLLGNAGNDRLLGAQGRDRLFGGPGADVLLGAKGNDLLSGGRGRDRLNGGTGNDDERR
jgi:uncharacterized delta-60 repeat protein